MSSSPSMSSNLFFPVSFSCFSCSNFCFAWSVLDAFRLDGREDIFFQTFPPRAVREFWSENGDLSFFGRLAPPSQNLSASERVCVCVRVRVYAKRKRGRLSLCSSALSIFESRARCCVLRESDEFALPKKNLKREEIQNFEISHSRECSKTAKEQQKKEQN